MKRKGKNTTATVTTMAQAIPLPRSITVSIFFLYCELILEADGIGKYIIHVRIDMYVYQYGNESTKPFTKPSVNPYGSVNVLVVKPFKTSIARQLCQ